MSSSSSKMDVYQKGGLVPATGPKKITIKFKVPAASSTPPPQAPPRSGPTTFTVSGPSSSPSLTPSQPSSSAPPVPRQAKRSAPVSFTMSGTSSASRPPSAAATGANIIPVAPKPAVVGANMSEAPPPSGLKYPYGDKMDWEYTDVTETYFSPTGEYKYLRYGEKMDWEDQSWTAAAGGEKGAGWMDFGAPWP